MAPSKNQVAGRRLADPARLRLYSVWSSLGYRARRDSQRDFSAPSAPDAEPTDTARLARVRRGLRLHHYRVSSSFDGQCTRRGDWLARLLGAGTHELDWVSRRVPGERSRVGGVASARSPLAWLRSRRYSENVPSRLLCCNGDHLGCSAGM